MEQDLSSASIWGLLDLFGPAPSLDLIHSAREIWRREWDSNPRYPFE
jgi:hypothetical protein